MSSNQQALLGVSAEKTASFIANLNLTTHAWSMRSCVCDTDKNMYAFGSQSGQAILIKYNRKGELVFQKIFSVALGGTLAIDSSNIIYVVGNVDANIYVVKINTSGTVISSHIISSGGSSPIAKIVESTLVISATHSSAGINFIGFDTSANTISWQHRWQDSSKSFSATAVVESPSFIYFHGQVSGSGVNHSFMAQLSKGGTINWQRGASSSSEAGGAFADSSNNFYIATRANSGSLTSISKFDSSFSGVTGVTSNVFVTIDSFVGDGFDNFYAAGKTGAVESGYVAKVNTSLTFSNQRSMFITGRPTNQYLLYKDITISGDNFFAVGSADDGALTYSRYGSALSAPLDGSKTGNYTVARYPSETYTFQYQSVAITYGSPFTPSTFSFGSLPGLSVSVSSSSVTVSDASGVSTITLIP
jgi:hypothetical protein